MVLGEVEEVHTIVGINPETGAPTLTVSLTSRARSLAPHLTHGIHGSQHFMAAAALRLTPDSTSLPPLQVQKRALDMLFLRGDIIILVSPPLRA